MPLLSGDWKDLRNHHYLIGNVFPARLEKKPINGKIKVVKLPVSTNPIQFTVYMAFGEVKTVMNNYIVLPVPAEAKNCKIINLTEYPGIFEDVQLCFPRNEATTRLWSQLQDLQGSEHRRLTTVCEVIDWTTMHQKPLSEDLLAVLRQYYAKNYCFVIIQVKAATVKQGWIGPIAFIHRNSNTNLFIPTRHHFRSNDLEGRYGRVDPVISRAWDLGDDTPYTQGHELLEFETKDPDPRDTRMLELIARRKANKTVAPTRKTPTLYIDPEQVIPVWDHKIYIWNRPSIVKNPFLSRVGCRLLAAEPDKTRKLASYLDPAKMPKNLCHGVIKHLHHICLATNYPLRLDLLI